MNFLSVTNYESLLLITLAVLDAYVIDIIWNP
jgi:hypothetical protein